MEAMQSDMKEWVENWKRVGPILEQIEMEALRAPDYHERLKNITSMLNWVCACAEPRKTSGLVEQQRFFMKMREQMEGNQP